MTPTSSRNSRRGMDGRIKHMKSKSQISGYAIRSAAFAVVFVWAIVGLASAFSLPSRWPTLAWQDTGAGGAVKPTTQSKPFTFEDRVAYQRAIEEVYWRHRIWPQVNQRTKPSLKEMMSAAQIESKVGDYLRNSRALEL